MTTDPTPAHTGSPRLTPAHPGSPRLEVAINYHRKNGVGHFYSPLHTFIDTSFLDTVSRPDIRSGCGEIMKVPLAGWPPLPTRRCTSLPRAESCRRPSSTTRASTSYSTPTARR